ncbi:unnamed protein product [Larinioides sclopetarius]|uniref:Uncharacterized protein n=1 Tax=Larinioides sclopetarius TaxID=280406 RepID=A0AAV1YRJ2_9ARAC
MSKRIKVSTYLENATSIPQDCSDVESELYDSDGELLDTQIDPQGNDENSAIILSSDEEVPDEDNIDQSSDSDCVNFPNKPPVSSEQLFCTTRRESSSELALNPYFQSKGCMCPIMHTPRSQEILCFKLPPKNQVLDEDCATHESFHDTEIAYIRGLSSSFFNFK